MKNYTAIYSTETYKDINYDFQAENMEKAIEFCEWKFSVVVTEIVEHLDSIKDVCNKLNDKYSTIKDFKLYVSGDIIKGGFYKMNYNNTPQGEYYFHETFCRLTDSINDFNKLFKYANSVIQKQLKNQKFYDEEFAKEENIKVNYKFDYSLIENEN